MVKKDIKETAVKIIPGFSQLFSKRPDQFSKEFWPSHYSKAKGTYIWDVNGKKFLDMSFSGIGANVLGYADKDVNLAVKKVIDNGSSSSLNPPEEVFLAELLCELHPWAHMVRFSRSGGEAVAIAVRIARTFTEKEKVLFCGYHGWHDWYLAANLSSKRSLDNHLLPSLSTKGVPVSLKNTAFPFNYNDLESFQKIFKKHKNDLCAVVMEPIRSESPKGGFLKEIKGLCSSNHIPLIFDEISSGFRLTNGGSHLGLKVNPDMAVFAKAMGNGFPISAIIGNKKFMACAEDSFISSTNWTERVGPAAALATINKFVENDVSKKLILLGKNMQEFWLSSEDTYHLGLNVTGIYPLSHFAFSEENDLKTTYFVEQMLKHNILASNRYYPNFSQEIENQETYFFEAEKIFSRIKKYSNLRILTNKVKGTISKPGFRRYT